MLLTSVKPHNQACSPMKAHERDFGMPRTNQMRSKTMAIMAAAVLFLPTVAHAQPSEGSAASWTFAVLTIWQAPHQSNIKREPYGVFTSQDDCEMARAKKIVELDSGNYRLPHLLPDQPVITTTVTVGADRSLRKYLAVRLKGCTSPIVVPKN